MSKEIERKFLVRELPKELNTLGVESIHQTYLAIGTQEVRLRHSRSNDQNERFLTLKTGKGLEREELNILIAPETYNQLLLTTSATPLIKKRTSYELVDQDIVVTVDEYQDFPALIIAEVEFLTIEEAEAFIPPTWLGGEVTEDKNFKNQVLWGNLQAKSTSGGLR